VLYAGSRQHITHLKTYFWISGKNASWAKLCRVKFCGPAPLTSFEAGQQVTVRRIHESAEDSKS